MTDSPTSADQPMEPVGTILARWRKRRRLTGQALGDRVGMSQAKISRLETGAVAAEPSDPGQTSPFAAVPAIGTVDLATRFEADQSRHDLDLQPMRDV